MSKINNFIPKYEKTKDLTKKKKHKKPVMYTIIWSMSQLKIISLNVNSIVKITRPDRKSPESK